MFQCMVPHPWVHGQLKLDSVGNGNKKVGDEEEWVQIWEDGDE